MRVSHILLFLALVGVVGAVVAVFAGVLVIREMELFGWKTPEISKKVADDLTDKGLQAVSGYTPAKTPAEAMDSFREAIQKRQYKYAAGYCTKPYADMLLRSHKSASELGGAIDHVRGFAKERGLLTDRITFALYKLDPFPTTFTIREVPRQQGEAKAFGQFHWDNLALTNPNNAQLFTDMKQMDPTLYNNVLTWNGAFGKPFEMVKEGEHWKIHMPTNPPWEAAVVLFNDRYKSYYTALDSFRIYMTNERFSSAQQFENEVLDKLKAATPK